MKIHQAHYLYIAFIVYEDSVAMIEQLWLSNEQKLKWIERDEYQTMRFINLEFKFNRDYLGCHKRQAFHKIKLFDSDNCDKS